MVDSSRPRLGDTVVLTQKEGGDSTGTLVLVVLVSWLRGEIPRSDLNWMYLAMALLKALFGV